MSEVACSRCGEEAVTSLPYAGTDLCEAHLCASVEKRVRRRIRSDGLFRGENVTWLVGLSGGKDSAVAATILKETFAENPRVDLRAVCVHEGIEGYRDESLAAAEALAKRLGMPLDVLTYEERFGVRMDEVVRADPLDMAPCAYCGVLRRQALEAHAEAVGADLLILGHNLDDEAQTAMMNFLEGDLGQIAKHYDASLAPLDERDLDAPFVPRAKPLRDVPEREIALYAVLRDLPAHMATCPHAEAAFRGTIQGLLHELEAGHPGTRHSIMSGYEDLAAMAARTRDGPQTTGACDTCGRPTTGERCRACQLLVALGAKEAA
ncbi:MAG: TIGR00269 family protein [Halobacteriales archaeon]